MRISDWSSDVCSSDLPDARERTPFARGQSLFDSRAQCFEPGHNVDDRAGAIDLAAPVYDLRDVGDLIVLHDPNPVVVEKCYLQNLPSAAVITNCPLASAVVHLDHEDRKSTRLNSSH